jgi:predicted nucleic acid-binding protein
MRLIFLDSGTLGMVSNPRGKSRNLRCQQWSRALVAAGAWVLIPEIADYEVRRELIRTGATTGLRRLDQAMTMLDLVPITSDVMLKAAEIWAQARNRGQPTASADALDGDVILAASALLITGPGDTITVATDNVGHLAQFVDARPWEQILP